MWSLLRSLWERVCRQRTAPVSPEQRVEQNVEILPEDWTQVANALRLALGLPLWDGPPRYPTPEECAAWEEAFPDNDMMGQMRRMAREEAEHRLWCAGHGVARRP